MTRQHVYREIEGMFGLVPSFIKRVPDSLAKLHGATDAEIEDAVHFAKSSAGWSAYINGLQVDFEQFKADVLAAYEHVRRQQIPARAAA